MPRGGADQEKENRIASIHEDLLAFGATIAARGAQPGEWESVEQAPETSAPRGSGMSHEEMLELRKNLDKLPDEQLAEVARITTGGMRADGDTVIHLDELGFNTLRTLKVFVDGVLTAACSTGPQAASEEQPQGKIDGSLIGDGSYIPESRPGGDPTKPDTETKQAPIGTVVEQYALDGGASEVCYLRRENGQLKEQVKHLQGDVASLQLASSHLEAVDAELVDIRTRMNTAESQLRESRGDDRNTICCELLQCYEQLEDISEAMTQNSKNSSVSNEIHRRAPKDS